MFFRTKCSGLIVALSVLLSVSSLHAAKTRIVSTQRPVTSPEERAALQRVLDQNAPVLEAQAATVKAVAKLLGVRAVICIRIGLILRVG